MTKLVILPPNERTKFDEPPKFNDNDRAVYFSLKDDDLNLVKELRAPTTKVGFALQLGYFKSNGKFYTSEQFREQDIKFVTKMLALESKDVDLSTYKNKIYTDHHKKILAILSWQPFNKKN